MKRALIVTSVPGFITSFEKNDIKILKDLGYIVDVATNYSIANDTHKDYFKNEINIVFSVDFNRSPFSLKTFSNYSLLKKILKENNYDLVHCHTPVVGVLTRFAAKKYRKNGLKVIYTAHGFHFFEGAPIINWLIYYNAEKYCSKFTDVLITMNGEDYEIANSKFKCRNTIKIYGVGVEIDKFKDCIVEYEEKRKELNLKSNDIVILSVGELIDRKNHKYIIETISKMTYNNIKYVICGKGPKMNKLKELAKSLNINDKVVFLGFRTDIAEICKISNLFVFPSLQEGLPVALMEAKASGLPICCSKIRGNTEVVNTDSEYDMTFELNDKYLNEKLHMFIEKNLKKDNKLDERFSIVSVSKDMTKIYSNLEIGE